MKSSPCFKLGMIERPFSRDPEKIITGIFSATIRTWENVLKPALSGRFRSRRMTSQDSTLRYWSAWESFWTWMTWNFSGRSFWRDSLNRSASSGLSSTSRIFLRVVETAATGITPNGEKLAGKKQSVLIFQRRVNGSREEAFFNKPSPPEAGGSPGQRLARGIIRGKNYLYR